VWAKERSKGTGFLEPRTLGAENRQGAAGKVGKVGKVQGESKLKTNMAALMMLASFPHVSTAIISLRGCLCVGEIEMYGKRNRGKENPVGGRLLAGGKRKLSLENDQRNRRGKNQSFIRHITLDSLRKCQKPLALLLA